MKKFTLKGVLDNFRTSVAQPAKADQEVQETLRPENFQVKRTFRHGFPFQPTAMAFDPVQRLLAIGTKGGSLRILGQPGVDVHVRHDMDGPPSASAVIHLQFLINEGAIVSVTADDSLHLWNFRQKVPQIVQSLKFQRERITTIHLPLQSKWLYVGTEKGNIHVVQIENFVLSGYIINWNKAIEMSRKTHPGPVVHLSDNPLDANRLLIGFETGQIVLWDLKNKVAEMRWQSQEPLRSITWHHEGKQFMCSHSDGSLTTWNIKQFGKPVHTSQPHAKVSKDGKLEQCKPINKVEWKLSRAGEAYVIFSGGMPYDQCGRTPSITVVHSKTTTVLEMEHNVVDFITLCESPYVSEMQEPYGIIVLLQNDLVVMDLQTSGFPCIENPYPMDIHESPVTCCNYMADCPADLVPALYSVGRAGGSTKRAGFSEREWPVNGGNWSVQSCSYSEIIVTGHADGSVKFWDASAGTLQVLYKLKTAKLFERPKAKSQDNEDDPFAIQIISLCPESRKLCIAGASSHVILFKYKKSESNDETTVLEIPIVYEILDDGDYSPDCEFSGPGSAGSTNKMDVLDFDNKKESSLKVKQGAQRKAPGFQAQLVCLTPWNNGEPPSRITALTINSSYGLMVYGNEAGIVIVDIEQKICLLNIGSPDLYGAQDPYSRVPRSPKKGQLDTLLSAAATNSDREDKQPRSPSVDQMGKSPSESPCLTPVEPAYEATEDFHVITPIPDNNNRRKSSTWKGLKRRLSRVDLKVKNTILGSTTADKPNASFYCDEYDDLNDETSGGSGSGSKTSPESEDNTIIENRRCPTPTSPKNIKNFDPLDDNDFTPKAEEGVFSADDSDNSPYGSPRARPGNLELFDEHGLPIRPSRGKYKKKQNNNNSPAKRDQRLLSIPNLKPYKPDVQQLKDLRSKEEANCHHPVGPHPTFAGNLMRRFNKLDSSFSRSRSSSISSLENITSEAIQCLVFAESYSRKTEPNVLTPSLWVGTSLGSVLTILISPPDPDSRSSQPVVVSLVGITIFRLKGAILSMAFLDCSGSLIPYLYESWKEKREKTPTRTQNKMSPPLGGENQNRIEQFGDRQFVVITSEKQARVVGLPSQTCIYRQQIADADFVVKAETITIKDSVCLVCYVSNGHLVSYSLPSLRPLMDIDFLPLSELSFQTQSNKGIVDPMLSIWGQQLIVNEDTAQISRTFCFSNKGNGLYLCSPSELQKFTLCSEFCSNLSNMLGDLFIPMEMPEPPKESFFKGLFGGGIRSLDREELFGEASGKANKSVAKHIPGSMQEMGARVTSSTSEISRAHKMVLERGEKLSQLEDRAERMRYEAENFSSSAHELMMKYKDKKWYQL